VFFFGVGARVIKIERLRGHSLVVFFCHRLHCFSSPLSSVAFHSSAFPLPLFSWLFSGSKRNEAGRC